MGIRRQLQVEWLREHGGLREDDDVLEVGCGIGRIAAPLTQYLRRGTYRGFDIVPHGIDWCRAQVTPRYPNFQFLHADIHNASYNPGGWLQGTDYVFPFPDGAFDFVFLTSVFTHMRAAEVEHYVEQIARVMRPGGRCYCTAFLVTAQARAQMDAGRSHRTFVPMADGKTWTDNPNLAEVAIGFAEDYLFGVFERAGLEITRVIVGEWWRDLHAQDTFVATKR